MVHIPTKNWAAMHFEGIYSKRLRHLSREHDKRLLAESKMRCAEEELADVRSREKARQEDCKRRAEEAESKLKGQTRSIRMKAFLSWGQFFT